MLLVVKRREVSVIKDMGRKELCKGEDGYKTTHNKIQYKKSANDNGVSSSGATKHIFSCVNINTSSITRTSIATPNK